MILYIPHVALEQDEVISVCPWPLPSSVTWSTGLCVIQIIWISNRQRIVQRSRRLDTRTCVARLFRGTCWCRPVADEKWQALIAHTHQISWRTRFWNVPTFKIFSCWWISQPSSELMKLLHYQVWGGRQVSLSVRKVSRILKGIARNYHCHGTYCIGQYSKD